jgi:hypothetical protein
VRRIRVSVPVHPTEDPAKVRRALLNLFPDLRIEATSEGLRGDAAGLDVLREIIRTQRIRDTARGVLRRGRDGSRTAFALSKQAAAVGRVNFASGSPLGDISVEIEADDLDAVIDFVAESTLDESATRSGRSGRT